MGPREGRGRVGKEEGDKMERRKETEREGGLGEERRREEMEEEKGQKRGSFAPTVVFKRRRLGYGA